MDGVDALVFTGGVGEHAAPVRAAAVEGLGFLGLRLDRAANDGCDGDGEIGATGAAARIFVLPAREDLEIARQVRAVLGA
jgi:acetate kinase